MIGGYFYNETVKSAIAAFGSAFSDIEIRRKDGKVIKVPIAYGPRQKWLEAAKDLEQEHEMFEKLLPRISFEAVALNYDPNRKLTNKQKLVKSNDTPGDTRQTVLAPVPYVLDFTMYITAKNLSDGWQIVEQILPFFKPAYTLEVYHYPSDQDPSTDHPENTYDMPITLTATTWADDYQGEMGDRRVIEWTMEFSSKIYLHGPINKTKVIYDSRAAIHIPQGSIKEASRNDSEQFGSEVGHANVLPVTIPEKTETIIETRRTRVVDSEIVQVQETEIVQVQETEIVHVDEARETVVFNDGYTGIVIRNDGSEPRYRIYNNGENLGEYLGDGNFTEYTGDASEADGPLAQNGFNYADDNHPAYRAIADNSSLVFIYPANNNHSLAGPPDPSLTYEIIDSDLSRDSEVITYRDSEVITYRDSEVLHISYIDSEIEVEYTIPGYIDSDAQFQFGDSENAFDNDNKYLEANITNLSDSDGNIVKIIRDINHWFEE